MLRLDEIPFYGTKLGAAYLADSLELMRKIPARSVSLVMTSPPFALKKKKNYGNVEDHEYVDWIEPFAREIHRILKDDGSFVVDIGGTWNRGVPTRSLYHYEVVLRLTKSLFHLAQEFHWYNPSKLPSPAEWVTIRRIRVKDAVNTVWWLSKSEWPKASNRKVLVPYSESMKNLLSNGYRAKRRPSGWDISTKFSTDNAGAIPPNILVLANTESNSHYLRSCRKAGLTVHPARFPAGLPEFFVKMLTDPGDVVLDPFAGSNVTGEVCERLDRRWIAIDLVREYLEGSKFRFDAATKKPKLLLVKDAPRRRTTSKARPRVRKTSEA